MTDVERSTRLWQEDANAMAVAIARHDDIVAESVSAQGGRLIKARGEGDSTFSVFNRAIDAARAAVALGEAVSKEEWPLSRPIRIRGALNFGTIEDRAGDCYGPEVNLCARLRAAAQPGQTLASGAFVQALGDDVRGLSLTPLGKHRLKDLAETVQVFQLGPPGSDLEFEPIASLNASAGFLPQFVSKFVHRGAEIEELLGILHRSRLVTVVGPGGVGKTRLAAEAARLFTAWTPDGAHFVDLGGIRSDDHLPGMLGPALKLRAGASVGVEPLVAELTGREACIILDHCEHLAQELAPLLRRITQACPAVTIVATSRATLKLPGEQVFRLLPFEVPQGAADLESIESSQAVQFFVSRAVMARHDFTLTSRNSRAIASICRQLDGIPAALEMAAVRVRSLSPEQLEERLSNRFRMLRAEGSQRSLQALFDWSWDSLGPHEQRFAWCSTQFEGSFDLEAAERVCEAFEAALGSNPATHAPDMTAVRLDPYAAIDHIDSLVEKSLLIAEDADSAMRYRLSSTFREYAHEKWNDQVARGALARAHAEMFHRRIGGLKADSVGEDAKNLVRAIDFFLGARLHDEAAELALFMTDQWLSAGAYAEGCRTMRRCLDASDDTHWPHRARLLNAIGTFEYSLGQYAASRAHLSAAIQAAGETRDDALRAKALNNLALLDMAENDNEAALRSLEAALPYDRALGDDTQLCHSLSNLGYLLILKGDLTRAKEVLEEALLVTGRSDDKGGAIPCLCNLSELALEQNDLDLSLAHAQRGLEYSEEQANKVGAACCTATLGELELRQGRLREAEALLRKALVQCIDMEATWMLGSVLDLLGIVFWRSGNVEAAKVALVHRRVASSPPSPARFAGEANEIFAQLESQVGAESLSRIRHHAEIGGLSSVLDALPRTSASPRPTAGLL